MMPKPNWPMTVPGKVRGCKVGLETRTGRGRDLDSRVRVGGDGSGLVLGVDPVDYTQHGGHEVDGKQVVGIGEEANAGDYAGADVVPAKGRLVDLGEGETTALIGVGNVSLPC